MIKIPSTQKKSYLSLIGFGPGRMKEKLSSEKNVKYLVAGLLACCLWSAWNLKDISTEYSYRQFYPQNHELLKTDREIQKIFQLNEKAPFLFVVTLEEEQGWLQKSSLEKLKKMSQDFQAQADVVQVLSMALVEGATQTSTQINVGTLFDRLKVSEWKAVVLKNPLIYPLLITLDLKSTLVIVESKSLMPPEMEKFAKNIETQIQKTFPKAKIINAGVPVMQSRLTGLIRSELSTFFLMAIVVFCGIFFILFSHWTAILMAAISLFATQVFALGLLVRLGISMNVLLSTLPIIVSVSTMSLLIHTFHLWSLKSEAPESKFNLRWALALETFRELLLPNFLGGLTTAFGFIALISSDIPIIKQYGWVVALIVTASVVFGQLVVLVGLPFVIPKMRSWFQRPAFWSLISIRHPIPIIVSLVGISIFGIFSFRHLNFSGKLFDDLPQGDLAREATLWIDQNNGGLVNYEFVLTSSEKEFWKDPSQLKKLNQLGQHLRKNGAIGSVVSIADFFQGEIPAKKAQIAETFFLFSMAEKNPLSSFLVEDSTQTRMMIRFKDQSTKVIEQSRAWVKSSVNLLFPGIQIREGGMAVSSHTINQSVSKQLVFGFWHPLLLIGIFLILIFRSLRWALLACLPNLVPPLTLFAVMAITQASLKPSVALVFVIALGFAFNNTVYFLNRLKNLLEQGPESQNLSLKRALLMEANPCLFESVVMFVGFSTFLMSKFSVNQTFGTFMMVSIVAGFLGDLMLLPALLKIFPSLILRYPKDPQISKHENQSHSNSSRQIGSRAAAILLFLFFSVPLSPATASSLGASEILRKSQRQIEAKDDQALVEMKIIEKNGEMKLRKMDLKTRRDKGFSVLARIQAPADVKGMAFLGQIRNGTESQWIYLPSSGQVRRVVTGKTTAGLLGSEISPEDLNSQAIRSSSVKLIQETAREWVIEVIPKKGTSDYSKVISHFGKADFLPTKTKYFLGNRLKKTIEFKEYKKIGSVFRSQLIDVRNHINGRKTEVRFTQMKVNSGLVSSDFSQSALKE